MRIRCLFIVACLAALNVTASAAASASELTVSAAASLQNAFREIGRGFEQAHPGTTLRFNFAGSGPLLAQLRQGAPVDVYASADHTTMDQAEAAGVVVASSRVDFAANALVLVVPATRQAPPSRLADLRSPAVRRIALGQPRVVPAGAYAARALQAAGLHEPLQGRFIYGDNVRQVLSYVSRGEVDAGFVYRSDALLDGDRVRIALTVPTDPPVRYPVARTAHAAEPSLADAFIRHLGSPAAQAILRTHGFTAP